MAVDLFFSLSGFIFFCFYSKTLSERRLSGQLRIAAVLAP